MHSNENFILHDFNLPNHDSQLSNAESAIEKIKKRLELIQKKREIDNETHSSMYEEIIVVLDYVGRLSIKIFGVEDEMEKMYTIHFKHSPELGKQRWLEHYEFIHRKYNVLKNRCFKLLDELDDSYIQVNKKFPANWNI